MIGKRIGKYRVVRKLGEGGMGVVYEALREDIEVRAAVKLLRSEFAQNPEIAARFCNEARAANLIAHASIVKVFDYGQEPDGIVYMAMEYLEGESLYKRMQGAGKLGKNDVLRLGRQIASALAAAHEKHIVHRDLKPDNIFIVPDAETPGGERIKLLDFGIAKIAAGRNAGVTTQANVIMGTPAYMSPEQCLGGKDVDGKTDVYALGVILFEMLAARPPFVAERPSDYMNLHLTRTPPLLTQYVPLVPSKLVGLVHAMLTKEPSARPAMEQVAAQLQRMLQGAQEAPAPVTAEPRPGQEERPTVPAKALSSPRMSGEIAAADLAVTTALRVKKPAGARNSDAALGAVAPRPAAALKAAAPGPEAVKDPSVGAFDPTSPGEPDFIQQLGGMMEVAKTIPVQSMRMKDLVPMTAPKAATAPGPPPAAVRPPPPSGPGTLTGPAWVPMEIVKSDYHSDPQVDERRSAAPPVTPPERSPSLVWVILVALVLVAGIALFLLRGR